MNNFYVYRHIRKDNNEPFYIGLGSKAKEFNTHYKEYERAYSRWNRNKFWKNIVAKTDYEIQIIFECNTIEEVREKEMEFIALYGRRDLGNGNLVNMTEGGDGKYGCMPSEEPRRKIGDGNRGKKISKETRRKIGIASKGRKHTTKSRKKISDSRRGSRVERCLILDLDMGIFYGSLLEACETTNCNYSTARSSIRRNSKPVRFAKA